VCSSDLIEEKISETEFKFSARIEVDYLNEEYDLEVPKSEAYETLGGFIIEHTENIPSENDKILIKGFEITVLKMSGAKIEEVYLRILEVD
jgi:CBS domain containing-hemolysin-like protein